MLTFWRDAALCLTADPEVFYPDPSDTKAIAVAKSWCAICPVIDPCKAEAMDAEGSAGKGNRWGIRGGTTGEERANEYRSKVRAGVKS